MEKLYTDDERQVLESFSASFWLKDAIKTATNRDILDALRDAETLVALLKKRAKTAGILPARERT